MPRILPIGLQKLYSKIEDCLGCKEARNPLRHIFGGGKFRNPKFFFLFINPTHKNRSSHPDYPGKRRYPFIGVRHLYKGLAEAGFVDSKLIADIYKRGWEIEDENRIEESLRANDVYISNFVKCARPNPINPTRSTMREHLPLLAEELRLVNPAYIVTFGLLPLSTLTDFEYRLRDILATARRKKYKSIPIHIGSRTYEILPCYYPLGHGNPPKAHKILSYIKAHF